jgi:hypothetical protein
MKLELSQQMFKYHFQEDPSSGRRVFACGRTDRQDKANNRFSEFCKAPKNYQSHQLGEPVSQLKMKLDTSRKQDYSFTGTLSF